MRRSVPGFLILVVLFWSGQAALAAYNHPGEKDSAGFLATYPFVKGTKLDSCATCHTGGDVVDSKGKTVILGSCQYCHSVYGLDGHGNIVQTLNPYGKDYLMNGRNQAALKAIEGLDSDKDGYSNLVEIQAIRYPGNPTDDPTKITAPSRVYTRAQLESLPQHTQFLLLDGSRSLDSYAEYSGVIMEDLLNHAGILSSATKITVYAPDGYSMGHSIQPNSDPSDYYVKGTYPQAAFRYDAQADISLNPTDGWCDYSAPSCQGRKDQDPIVVSGGLRMILAIKRDKSYLTQGVLNSSNVLDGDGPYRVVPPQKSPNPPDQSATAKNQSVVWPYNANWDHNSGYATRTTTIIKVEPLPAGTTDINIYEAGWNYVDEGKLIVYGAISGDNQNSVATFDAEARITVYCAQYSGAKYQLTLDYYTNPADSQGCYWKLEPGSVKSGTCGDGATCIVVDQGANMTLSSVAYNGTNYRVTLTYYANPADPENMYWKLSSISPN
ncbi:MAG: hypothetical protein HQK60_06520 [Deltaproteobacteria bacterium]|nr:hypothetical protein [Deltaproteobacteria bacterium]